MKYCSAIFLLLSFGTFAQVVKFYRESHQIVNGPNNHRTSKITYPRFV